MSGEEIFKKRKRDEYEGISWTKEKGTMIPAFLQKTYEIMHNQEYSKYVAWNSDKDAIHIIDPVNFAREVLPRYFKHSNFASFVRQLNMYGFHKTKQDPDWREFKHQYFKYGRPDLLQYIKRKSNSSMLKTIPLPDDDLPTQMAELQDRFDTLEQKYTDLQSKHSMLLSRMHSYEINEQDRVNKDMITRNCLKFLLNNAVEKGAISRNAVLQLLTNPRQDNMLTNVDGLNMNSNGQIPLIMNQPCDARLQGMTMQQQQQQQHQNQQNQQIPPPQIMPQPRSPTAQTAASLLQSQSLASALSPILNNPQAQLQQQQQQLQQMQMNYGIEPQSDDMDPFYPDYSFSTEHNPNSAFSQPPLQVEEVSTVTHSIPNTPQLDPIASPYLDFDKPSDL